MHFYEVAPASRQYHGTTPLTYSSDQPLDEGQIIVVKIRMKTVMAFVIRAAPKPDFKTNPIDAVAPGRLPHGHIELFNWLLEYYPAPLGIIAQQFLPLSQPKQYDPAKPKSGPKRAKVSKSPPLTTEQKNVLGKITSENQPVLLHGATGTGKTRIYIELAKQTLAAGKSALILVPEIALSPQIVASFETHLANPVHVTHSGLTPARRRNVWQAVVRSRDPQIVIGPRSALFMPLANIGLVVIDEFHEPAYKQDQAPYYQTIRVASQLARLHKARLVMGSATPPISEYYIAQAKNIPIIRMDEKAVVTNIAATKTHIVNIRDEDERTPYPLITKTLLKAIGASLARQEQTLLFLNKRGSARLILCQNCGWHAVCPRCDLPYTYHGDTHRLQCHTCGNHMPAPSVCPECTSHDIIFKSPGTKAIVVAVTHAFPDARIARFDKDNLKAERLETRHGEVMRGEIDILIGTQLLAKGHDLPRLSLVGILLAENELQFPDYTSSERSYQLMHQLIGRVGRGHRSGEVVVQTYDPDNIAVQTAVRHYSWQQFYEAQILERKQFEFPPFVYIMKIEVTRARMETVSNSCDQIIKFLRESGEPVKVSGPAPSFIEKRNNTWTWQIIVKSKQRPALTRLARSIPVQCIINLDPGNLL